MTDIIVVTNQPAVPDLAAELEANTPEEHRVIVTAQDASAAVNRNVGLAQATTEIVVMLDDDISGLYPGWLTDLTAPLEDADILLVSARLVTADGAPGAMMGSGIPLDDGVHETPPSRYRGYMRVPTAAIAFRAPVPAFDEGFIGSGYEDTDWMYRLNEACPGRRIVITNRCRLVHANEMKSQGGPFWQHNHDYFMRKYPDDLTTMHQTDWTRRGAESA